VLLYAMSMGSTSPVMPGTKINIDPDKELMPVTIIAGVDNLLYVSPKTPFRTVKEVIDTARAQPGKLTYGSSGVGGSYHLWAAFFTSLAHIDILHVPFRGGPPAIAEIIAGRVDMMFGNLSEVFPHIKSGAVRPIAFTSVPPSPELPGYPTVVETLPGYEVDNWFGLGLPAGTPQDIADRLNREVNKALTEPDFRAKLIALGYQPRGGSSEAMQKTILSDRAKWKKVIDENGIRAE
jgi:tripartite-type tricarboxylate transporter receptor subunit TctC